MFTGHYALKHGVGTSCDSYHALARNLPDLESLLHHRLKAQGYRCGFAGKWHVDADLGPVDHGFEGMNLPGYGDLKQEPQFQRYLRANGLSYGSIQEPIYANPGKQTLSAGRWNGPVESTPTHYLADYTTDMLTRFAADGQPFFLTCQFWGPHSPYLPSPEFAGRHDPRAIPPWINFDDDHQGKPDSVTRFNSDFYRTFANYRWSDWQQVIAFCYDFTTMIDAQIGRIVDRLDQLGVAENTIVIFESDHGDSLGCHHGLFDKGHMYQEDYRIPLLVRWPARVCAGTKCDELVYNMDLMPIILDIIGQPDDLLDGKSFLPCLGGTPQAGRDAIYLEFHGLKYLYSQRAVVTKEGYKYIFTPGDQDEFYDLNQDPGELHNVIAVDSYRERVEDLRHKMMEMAGQVGDPLADCICKLFGHWDKASKTADPSDPVRYRL
ncbi:MAG TPA: hypothetical protein DCP08_09080 [Chloroflexi bacterium]|nr:hypothetical protein [Chloroflexota bacterium]